MKDGFIKVAAGTPNIRVADCQYNAREIISLIQAAEEQGVKVLALPELCLTGYTCGDLFLQPTLLQGAEDGLAAILAATRATDVFTAVGMPIAFDNKLYNCAVIIQRGNILGAVPKTHIPNYGEFYEGRWFTSGKDMRAAATLCGQPVDILSDRVYRCKEHPNLVVGLEICEDLWTMEPPSGKLSTAGATLILNLSASNETVGKADYRRRLVESRSARCACAYVYAGAGEGESTADLVFAGHNLIAESGTILAETRFATGLTVAEVDVDKLVYERRRVNTFALSRDPAAEVFGGSVDRREFSLPLTDTVLTRAIPQNPFVPDGQAAQNACWEEMLTLAALALKQRLAHTGAKTAVLGLSGGLDSTLAALITVRALDMLGRPRTDLLAVTMPCFGTTDRTRSNAEKLAGGLGAALRTVDIGPAVKQHFADIGQSMEDHGVTYENAQARERTQVLMDIANQTGGLVVGTGDLSELALGWCTYNGDQMSMYAVNSSIPKTLVRRLTAYAADTSAEAALAATLRDILDTPVSPELLPAKDGRIAQKTEDLVGPYELHDFFLYHILRWGFPPRKVLRLAQLAFAGAYDRDTILKWLKTFYRRFFSQQFKRDPSPNGPKVGSLSLSPRGDWRMPSDASANLWLAQLEDL